MKPSNTGCILSFFSDESQQKDELGDEITEQPEFIISQRRFLQ